MRVCVVHRCVHIVGGVLQDAKEVVIIITGVSKAIALQQVVEGAMSHQWTASAIQMHPNGIIVADEDATNELKVSTFITNDLAQICELTT